MNSIPAFLRHHGFKLVFASAALVLISIDLASTLRSPSHVQAVPVSQLKDDGVPPGYVTRVALVRSDDSALPAPVPLDAAPTTEQILEMVYLALDTEGGLAPLLFPGARVTVKPNVVEPAPLENGVNTDPRVVEGLIRWMAANGPGGLEIAIAEAAGGWLSPAMRGTKHNSGGAPVIDGFEEAGYRGMVRRLADDGIEAWLIDANFGSLADPLDGIRLAPVPDYIDFPEYAAYWVHEAFLDADVFVNVPVMKTHTPQITVCLKNYIGIAAGAKYGTYKGRGGPEPDDPDGLHQNWPEQNSIEREIIDLASLAPSDYCLVDALVCKERGKTEGHPSVRRNMVLAGPDMVAVDAVCARLMGLNPDDIPHLVNAAREGLGTNDAERTAVLGEHGVEDSVYHFERVEAGNQGNRGHFSMGNRVWMLNHADGNSLEASLNGVPDGDLIAEAGVDGWTEPICFSDDFIEMEAFYGPTSGKVFFAFAWLSVPEAQEAELWIAHDEACAVWIAGEEVYRSEPGYLQIELPASSSATVQLEAGVHPLLVKLVDESRTAPFVLNLCRVMPQRLPAGMATYTDLSVSWNARRYEGVRVPGLKFPMDLPGSDVSAWMAH